MYDTIDFVVMDPLAEKEDWAVTWFPDSTDLRCIRILINGREFIEIVNEAEQEKCGKQYGYGHAQINFILYDLDEENKDSSIWPLCCPACGDTGCCTFSGSWHEEGDCVVWDNFSSNALMDYGLEFRFEKEDYYRKLAELKKHGR